MITLINDYLKEASCYFPEKVAIRTINGVTTYHELDDWSDKFATYLLSSGVKKGDRVVIEYGNVAETVVVFWGCLKAGAVVSVISPELPINRALYIISDSGAKVLCSSNDDLHEKCSIFCDVISKSKLSELKKLSKSTEIVIDQEEINANDLALIIYTSGSTGESKGVVMTHENIIAVTNSINSYLDNQAEDIILCALPLSFDYGLYQMIMSISKKATLVLEKNFLLPLGILKRIYEKKVTAVPCVPSMVTLMWNCRYFRKYDLSSVRYVTNTGASLSKKHIKQLQSLFPGAKIYSMYGVTECKRCTYLPPEEIDSKPESVGKAIPGLKIYVINEAGEKLEPYQIGQLVVSGPTIMQGYWNKPEITKEKLKTTAFSGDELLLHTGDYGYLDNDGYFYYKGRLDEVIKCRGVKVIPKEVEDVALQIDDVKEAAVTDVVVEENETDIALFVSIQKDTYLTDRSILRHYRDNLEKEKIPKYIVIIDELPKNPNGKIDKISLRKDFNSYYFGSNNAAK